MQFTATMTLAASALLFAAPTAGPDIEVGDQASYSFSDAPLNSMGVKSLEALRGKPVLIEFWGTH